MKLFIENMNKLEPGADPGRAHCRWALEPDSREALNPLVEQCETSERVHGLDGCTNE